MRMMQKDGGAYEVYEHIMTQNMWEFYILGPTNDDNVAFALVCGEEDELGFVSLDEIGPFIISRTKTMDGVMPAPGYSWLDN